MINSFKYNTLETISLLLLLIILAGCATTMRVVEKSLEENDFVPEEAVSTFDFLNEYDHHLPKPQKQLIDVDIAFERENVLISGDSIYTQIALTSKAPPRKANNIHLLVYNSAEIQSEELTAMQHAVHSIASGKIPVDSTLTVDWYDPNRKIPASSLLDKNHQSNDLVSFLRQFVRLKLDKNPHHFVLVIGGHSDLTHEQKQNLVDIVNIFQVQSSTLSVLSVANKPEVAFFSEPAKQKRQWAV